MAIHALQSLIPGYRIARALVVANYVGAGTLALRTRGGEHRGIERFLGNVVGAGVNLVTAVAYPEAGVDRETGFTDLGLGPHVGIREGYVHLAIDVELESIKRIKGSRASIGTVAGGTCRAILIVGGVNRRRMANIAADGGRLGADAVRLIPGRRIPEEAGSPVEDVVIVDTHLVGIVGAGIGQVAVALGAAVTGEVRRPGDSGVGNSTDTAAVAVHVGAGLITQH